jgi:nucleotide-binding universal stress UspA family protein
MKRHILLPTDFSDNAWSAIDYALKLFSGTSCNFYLLNSIALKAATMSNFSSSLMKVMKENANRELYELKQQIEMADHNTSHEFHVVVSSLDLFDAIEIEVKSNPIDLVIMGTKGATGAKELLFGSNTVNVLKKLKSCPVLVVPNEYDYKTPRQIALPTDYKRNISEQELNPVKNIVSLHNSKIRILHINEEEELSKEQEHNYDCLKTHLMGYNYSFHWMPDYSSKTDEINTFIEDLEIDMLAMLNYKKSCIARIAREPVIKKIGFKPVIPFLVIPA